MKNKKVLSKFTILCWATFTLGCMGPTGCRLDTTDKLSNKCEVKSHCGFNQRLTDKCLLAICMSSLENV